MGELTRAGESRPATPHDLDFYERAQGLQALQRVPVLQPAGDPHAYVFYALFDGTRQDAEDPDQLPTNIGVLKRRIEELRVQPAYRIGGRVRRGHRCARTFPDARHRCADPADLGRQDRTGVHGTRESDA